MDVIVRGFDDGSGGGRRPSGYDAHPEVFHINTECHTLATARGRTEEPSIVDLRLDLDEAIRNGWRPCKVCSVSHPLLPDRLTPDPSRAPHSDPRAVSR